MSDGGGLPLGGGYVPGGAAFTVSRMCRVSKPSLVKRLVTLVAQLEPPRAASSIGAPFSWAVTV